MLTCFRLLQNTNTELWNLWGLFSGNWKYSEQFGWLRYYDPNFVLSGPTCSWSCTRTGEKRRFWNFTVATLTVKLEDIHLFVDVCFLPCSRSDTCWQNDNCCPATNCSPTKAAMLIHLYIVAPYTLGVQLSVHPSITFTLPLILVFSFITSTP